MKTLRNLALGAALAVAFGTSAMAMDKVRIGTTPESYPPFTQIEADGSVSGFEAEIADALCAKMEVECEWVLQAWDGIIPALQANKFDAIIASMSITDKRKEVIDFSNKYYNTPAMFVGPKDKDVTISAEGLSGVTVGVQTATTHAEYMKQRLPDVRVKTYDTQENANLDLIAGRVDLLLADSIALTDGLLKAEGGDAFEVKGEPFTDPVMGDGVGVGIRKGEDELREKFNAAIEAIRADGTYKAINDKYFGFDAYGG